MFDKRKARWLFGETLRDIGILVFVFGPLDAFFQRDRSDSPVLATMIAVGLLLIAAGIMIEAKE